MNSLCYKTHLSLNRGIDLETLQIISNDLIRISESIKVNKDNQYTHTKSDMFLSVKYCVPCPGCANHAVQKLLSAFRSKYK
jgi:hypothetical protein